MRRADQQRDRAERHDDPEREAKLMKQRCLSLAPTRMGVAGVLQHAAISLPLRELRNSPIYKVRDN